MAKSVDEVKDDLSSKYLGQAGIHSIGVSRSDNAIRLYLEDSPSEDQASVLEEIANEAVPYRILIIPSARPTIG